MTRHDTRKVLALSVLLVGVGVPPGAAHTREGKRIDDLEASVEQRNALLTASVKDALDAAVRLEEAVKERAEHARHLGSRIDSLRSDVTTGLSGVVGSVTAAMATPLRALEERVDARIKDVAATEALLRKASLDPLEARLAEAVAGAARDTQALRAEAAELRSSLAGLRAFLSEFAGTLDGRLAAMDKELAALKQQQLKDREAAAQRSETLLKVVSEENQKLRRGLEQLAGGGAGTSPGTPGVHVVQKGENLYGIARKYGVSFEALQAVNPEFSGPDAVVHPGASLKLPTR